MYGFSIFLFFYFLHHVKCFIFSHKRNEKKSTEKRTDRISAEEKSQDIFNNDDDLCI